MRRVFVCTALILGLLVAFNIHTRPAPVLSLGGIFPALAGWKLLASAAAFALRPGLYALWYLGFTPSTPLEVGVMAAISLWAWGFLIRTPYAVIGTYFGFYNPNHFRYFLWLPWRPLWKIVRIPLRWREEVFKHSNEPTGGWAMLPEVLCLVHKAGDIFLSRARALGIALQQPVGITGDRHVAIIAGAGSGKTSHAITWLVMHEGSAFIIDPKGLMARTTARRMGEGGNGVFGKKMTVRVLDPFGLVNERLGWWDPFAQMEKFVRRNGPDSAVRYAMKIADGLILRYGQENPFWPGSAKQFLLGLILYVFFCEPPEKRNLVRLYELLYNGLPERTAAGKSPFGALLRAMSEMTAYGGVIAASANALADAGETTYGNILITMREQLKWLALPELRAICLPSATRKEVDLEQLVIGLLALYLSAPVTDIRGPLAGWFRLITVLALYAFEEMQRRLNRPCLFLLDEFPSLGKIESIEIAAPVMRSMGVRLCVIAQDIAQFRDVYTNTWEGFLGNAEVCVFMASNHQETLLYEERGLGTNLVRRKVDGGWPSNAPARHEHRNEPLMYAEQIKRFQGLGNMINIRPDARAFTTKRTPYFKYAPVYFYEPDRDHREVWQRRLTRAAFKALLPAATGQTKGAV